MSAENPLPLTYSPGALHRGDRALRCSPFRLALLAAMGEGSIPLPQIAEVGGYERGYTKIPLSERRVERELLWLIEVGLLRREVDGQGITDSFRLTPLGRQLLKRWDAQGELSAPPWWERWLYFGDRLRWLF
ncbi:MAG: hypothetical protein HC890_11980 [Chloroflexaceae bacterium]|nr:hypothetical protein [Chloroflexaceae bacterium]